MIRINNQSIPFAYRNGLSILSVYINGRLIWPETLLVLSCYYNGYWVDENPWTDDTPWKD